MAQKKQDERYLNITLTNEEEEKDSLVISLSAIFKMLKKYFPIWLVTAVVSFALIFAVSFAAAPEEHKKISALVSFTFDGIEKGLDPAGNEFDARQIKNPAVIEAALTELDEPLDDLEKIRQGISFESITPADAIDKITAYKSVYENAQSGALSAAQAMLDVDVYPTQFKVYFNYSKTEYNASRAVEVFNTILECYRDYFFETYGYNKALGNAVTAIDYTTYDYAEAVDVFDTSLHTLQKYVDNIASEDKTRFRSSVTGYTFSDLSEAIKSVRSIDLDVLSSYITVNNVTKDKDSIVTYYQYRIESLTRQKKIAEENLATITDTINSYVKDTVMIFGNGTENTDTEYTQSSAAYDKLIAQKIEAQDTLSTNTQQIDFYQKRIDALKGKPAGTDAQREKVEADLSALNDKVNSLLDTVNKTADEYYENVSFANAYNILVPASTSAVNTIKIIINSMITKLAIVEALFFAIYIVFAFIKAVITETNKKNSLAAIAKAAGYSDEPDTDEADDEAEEEQSSKKTAKAKK